MKPKAKGPVFDINAAAAAIAADAAAAANGTAPSAPRAPSGQQLRPRLQARTHR